MFFSQTFSPLDLGTVSLLVVLEGVMSIDNALVLGLLARRVPREQRPRALSYGLIGAFVFRLIATGLATYLLRWSFVKLAGGAYLLWTGIRHFWSPANDAPKPIGGASALTSSAGARHFWMTVAAIELTDIAFAVDSILAAVALVGPPPANWPIDRLHPKLWVVVTGGLLGVVLMRFAAALFIRLLEKFPRMDASAYLLIIVVGLKLALDWAVNTKDHPHRLNFGDPGTPIFWLFWGVMAACLAVGFLPKRSSSGSAAQPPSSPAAANEHETALPK